MEIRKYVESDNLGWVRCRVLSFIDSAYYDNVLREKEKYQNPSVELVAVIHNNIVGLLDLEYELEKEIVGNKTNYLTGVIWHIAVLPEYRNKGVATALLNEAIKLISNTSVKIIQAWTRDDQWVINWNLKREFVLRENESYLHVFTQNEECNLVGHSEIKDLYICNSFNHYIGSEKEMIKQKFKRVHTCNLLELNI